MSRIGKKPIPVPTNVEVNIEGRKITVKGPKGTLTLEHRPEVKVEWDQKERLIYVRPVGGGKKERKVKAFWGLYRALINNMVVGVSQGFTKRLYIEGKGYSARVQKNELILELGYCHPVKFPLEEGIQVQVKGNWIEITGADKQKVGQLAANIYRSRPPNVYTGKGVRYEGQEIKLKPGKVLAAGKGM